VWAVLARNICGKGRIWTWYVKNRHALDLQKVAMKCEQQHTNRMDYNMWEALGRAWHFDGISHGSVE
jgi:hypothetical protein